MIRKLWKQIMDKAYGDVSFLITHLYEKRKISSGQRDIIKSKDSHRKQMIELLMRIEKKDRDCLIEFFNGIKQIEPLADLHNEIEKEMANCGKLYSQYCSPIFVCEITALLCVQMIHFSTLYISTCIFYFC